MSVLSHNDDLQEELLQEFSILESKVLHLNERVGALETTLKTIITMLKSVAKEKGISLETSSMTSSVKDDGTETCTIN